MARLNEAAVPVDPVELLRRKYSRQNKEIARINSTQCIRIRNLENEVSRLLAENLGLREQILRLHNENESKRAQQIADHVNTIKSNLEAKILELGALVTSLGDEPRQPEKQAAKKEKLMYTSPTQSPDQRNWKNMYTLSEAAGLQDGRLPPILEDKSYPRRTLEPAEVIDIMSDPVADNTDSPDIGPPPVSKFINEDPVKIDLPNRTETEGEEGSTIDPTRSINLEQRRKRKDSSGPPAQKRPSRFEPNPIHSGREGAQSLKIGAKRKLSNRDDEDGATSATAMETSPEDFKYTRRITEDQSSSKIAATEKSSAKPQREFAVARGPARDKTSSALSTNNRKVLGPKTANTDVANSPRKVTKSSLLDDSLPERREISGKDQTKERIRERRSELVLIKPTVKAPSASINIEPEPETPAALDLFSPPASGSSVPRAESRDTPPPPDLGPGMEGQRPSRRARGSVSYAEPNLRDKMRRPTKELVDAVTGEGKAQRLSVVKLETDAPVTVRKMKEEVESDDTWKHMPSTASVDLYSKSPLVDKIIPRDPLPEAVLSERQRRRSAIKPNGDWEMTKSGSSYAISALLVGSRKIKQELKEQAEANDNLENAMAKLDIYEFTGSSPREASDSRIPTGKEDWCATKTSRRLSSMVQEMASASAGESSDGEGNSRPGLTSSRRRQSMMGLGSSSSNTNLDGQKSMDGIKKSINQSMPGEAIDGNSRSERLNARRRSMML